MFLEIKSKKYGRKIILIDYDDYYRVNSFKWWLYYYKENDVFYVKSKIKIEGVFKTIALHRLIVNCPVGMVVDHKNHNTLDNRKENLRICTNSENRRNTKKRKDSATSKYKGIYWNKKRNKWHSQIRTNKKQIFLGLFDCEIEAAKAYDKAAIKYHGEFAYINNYGGSK